MEQGHVVLGVLNKLNAVIICLCPNPQICSRCQGLCRGISSCLVTTSFRLNLAGNMGSWSRAYLLGHPFAPFCPDDKSRFGDA